MLSFHPSSPLRRLFAGAAVLAALVLAGCDNTLILTPYDDPRVSHDATTADGGVEAGAADAGSPFRLDSISNLHRFTVGTKVTVRATIIHAEIEGSTTVDVSELTSGDPSIVTVRPDGSMFEIEAVAAGETVLYGRSSYMKASVPFRVEPSCADAGL